MTRDIHTLLAQARALLKERVDLYLALEQLHPSVVIRARRHTVEMDEIPQVLASLVAAIDCLHNETGQKQSTA